jgi:hypothetical protein
MEILGSEGAVTAAAVAAEDGELFAVDFGIQKTYKVFFKHRIEL